MCFVIYSLLIPCKDLGRMKTYTFLKIILLYIVATMTNDIIRGSGGSPHHHQIRWRSTQWLLKIQGSSGGLTTTETQEIRYAIHTLWFGFQVLWMVSVVVTRYNASYPSMGWAVSKTVNVPAGQATNCTNHTNSTNH